MPGTTPILALRYPVLADPADAQGTGANIGFEDSLGDAEKFAAMRFTSASDRSTKVTSPTEGMWSYLTDVKRYEQYLNATIGWVPVADVAGKLVTTSGFIHTGITTTETDIPKLAIENFMVVNGHWYILHVEIGGNASTTAASYFVRVRKDTALTGTEIAAWPWLTIAGGADDSKHFTRPWKATADDTDADFYVSIQRLAGSGDIDVYGERKTAFWIERKGLSSGIWSEVA